jgi:hypothetical protein
MSPTTSASSCIVPGGRATVWWMWLSRSKSGSSIHTGCDRLNGTGTSRRRNGSRRWMRSLSRSTTRSKLYGTGAVDGSSTRVPTTWECADGVSM